MCYTDKVTLIQANDGFIDGPKFLTEYFLANHVLKKIEMCIPRQD
jgi:hypothetical protein